MLEFLKEDVKEIGEEKIVVMDDLRKEFPEKFNESGSMDYNWFEKEIRPNSSIYVRRDKNSVSFTLQSGPIKENGKNGCQVTSLIEVAKHLIKAASKDYPCVENRETIRHLDNALEWQKKRTRNRIEREVEGTSQV